MAKSLVPSGGMCADHLKNGISPKARTSNQPALYCRALILLRPPLSIHMFCAASDGNRLPSVPVPTMWHSISRRHRARRKAPNTSHPGSGRALPGCGYPLAGPASFRAMLSPWVSYLFTEPHIAQPSSTSSCTGYGGRSSCSGSHRRAQSRPSTRSCRTWKAHEGWQRHKEI